MKMSRKALFGWIIGSLIAVSSVVLAAAISVVLTSQFGSGISNTTNPCDSSMQFGFGPASYSQPLGDYAFTTVTYENLNVTACDTQTMRVTVVDVSNAALANASLLIDDTNPAQAPGTDTPPNGSMTLSAPVTVSAANRIVMALTSN